MPTYRAILTMLINGKARYFEGRTAIWPSGSFLRILSSQFLCHERATINGVQLLHTQGKHPNQKRSILKPLLAYRKFQVC